MLPGRKLECFVPVRGTQDMTLAALTLMMLKWLCGLGTLRALWIGVPAAW